MNTLGIRASRTPQIVNQRLALAQLNKQQSAATLAGQRVTTGRRVLAPSDDVAASVSATSSSIEREQNNSFLDQVQQGVRRLSVTDGELEKFINTVDQAKQILLRVSNDTARSDVERSADLIELDQHIETLLASANTSDLSNPLFGSIGGLPTNQAQFSRLGNYIEYTGPNQQMIAADSPTSIFSLFQAPNQSIGTDSRAGAGLPLNPIPSPATRLKDLNGGLGVEPGMIEINAGSGFVPVDLSVATTIDDVLNSINTSGSGASAILNPTTHGIYLTGPGAITVRDVSPTNTATDLKINGTGVLNLNGGDLDPVLSNLTPISMLNDGTGVSLAGGVRIVNGPYDSVVNLAGVTSVGEVLDRFNASNTGVRAELNAERTAINVVSTLAGAPFSITESSTFSTTARDLGILTTNVNTRLADLNGGAGLDLNNGNDLVITLHDTSVSNTIPPRPGTFEFDLSDAVTLGDVIQKIESGSGNRLQVRISGLGQMLVTDLTTGAGLFSVSSIAASLAAEQLGIAVNAGVGGAGQTITGTPQYQARVESVFDSLLQARAAIANRQDTKLKTVEKFLNQDRDRLLSARGSLATTLNRLTGREDQLNERITQQKQREANLLDIDLATAVTEMTATQQALQATLSTTAQLGKLSLLDYL